MPLYDFRCKQCAAEFEALVNNSSAEGLACPECGEKSLSRLISRFAVTHARTPCGTKISDASSACQMNAMSGGCGGCGVN